MPTLEGPGSFQIDSGSTLEIDAASVASPQTINFVDGTGALIVNQIGAFDGTRHEV
jgi:hypothetical protein